MIVQILVYDKKFFEVVAILHEIVGEDTNGKITI